MHVAIIGAGFAGLAAAHRLQRAGLRVTLVERATRAGGLAGGFREPHWAWHVEYFYHHWFASDRYILAWLREMGLHQGVRFSRPLTVVYHDGAFYPLDSPVALLRFPGLGLWAKVRMGLVLAYLRLTRAWSRLEKHTAHAWLARWMGRAAYTTLWEPLLEGKFGPYYQEVNMAWFWARVHARTPRLGTYEGGFQALADAIVDRLQAQGVEVLLGREVLQVTGEAGAFHLVTRTAQGETQTLGSFAAVLITLGPPFLERVWPPARERLTPHLRRPYLGAVTLVLALRRRFRDEGYYWYNIPKRAGFPFLILVEHTHFVPPEHFGGDHILYVGDYVPPDHPYMRMDRDALLATFLPGLQRVQPAFDLSWVRKAWLFRTPYAQPVPLREASRNLPPRRLAPGLYWASMSHVYPWDRGTNYAVALGQEVARQLLQDLPTDH